MRIAGLILAGGASRRMGSPKALLTIQGETFLNRLVRLFRTVCSDVVVVLGHDAERIRAGSTPEADYVINIHHALGQLTSLQCGLRSLADNLSLAVAAQNRRFDAVLFTPVDYPNISGETVSAVVNAMRRGDSFVIPKYAERRGHPILFRAELISEFLALDLQQTARDVVHRHVGSTRYIEVSDPGIIEDIDVPGDYDRLIRSSVAQ